MTTQLRGGRTDARGLPIIEQVHENANTAYIEHDPVTGEPLMLRTSTGLQSLYVNDGTGNPLGVITTAGYPGFTYSYDPYGVPTLTQTTGGNGVPQNPYQFKQGIQECTTGWIKYGARYYDPATGRFTQQDTLDTPLNPANANRYAYAANNPLNLADPAGTTTGGLLFGGIVGGLIGATAGVVVGVAVAPFVSPVGAAAIGAAVGGCLTGTVGVGATNAFDQANTSLGDIGAGCGAGLTAGAAPLIQSVIG